MPFKKEGFVNGGCGKSPLIYPNLSLPEMCISTTWDQKAELVLSSLMLIIVVGGFSGQGRVWTLIRASMIFVVNSVNMES